MRGEVKKRSRYRERGKGDWIERQRKGRVDKKTEERGSG
jgi:hypothetical protein